MRMRSALRLNPCSHGFRIPPVSAPQTLVSAKIKPPGGRHISFAETVGFEPTEPVTARLVSSEVLSTTQPRLQYSQNTTSARICARTQQIRLSYAVFLVYKE